MLPSDENPPPSNGPADPEAILRTVLGGASPSEAEAVRRAVELDPAAARTAGVLREVRDAIACAAAEAADPPPASLFVRAKSLSQRLPHPPAWFDRLSAAVFERIDEAVAGLAGGPMAVPALRGDDELKLHRFAHGALRLDAAATRAADGAVVLRMQLDADGDGSLAGDFALLESDSGAVVAEGRMTDDGGARVSVAGAAAVRCVDIAVRCAGHTLVARGILLA